MADAMVRMQLTLHTSETGVISDVRQAQTYASMTGQTPLVLKEERVNFSPMGKKDL